MCIQVAHRIDYPALWFLYPSQDLFVIICIYFVIGFIALTTGYLAMLRRQAGVDVAVSTAVLSLFATSHYP